MDTNPGRLPGGREKPCLGTPAGATGRVSKWGHDGMMAKMKPVPPVNQTEEVNAFMEALDHPFKAEVQAVRAIIMGVNDQITEQIKWAAPTFSYKGYMATFNLWAKQHVHLVFHNGAILSDADGLLEGDYPDRRMVYFSTLEDVLEKQAALEKLVEEWVKVMDEDEQ
jgi:hypothetical protein